jgi:hypothetical protein
MKDDFITDSLFLYIEKEIAAKLNIKSIIYDS